MSLGIPCEDEIGISTPSIIYVLGVVRYGFHEWDASSSYGSHPDVLCSGSGEVDIVTQGHELSSCCTS